MFERSSQRAQEVIFFITEDGVTKEMMYTEFEAVLDGIVGLEEFAGTTAYCVFAVINPGLNPQAFVFFTISFDARGEPPTTWNVPFQSLIQKSSPVAFGPFNARVVTSTACSTEWHKSSLWDPSEQVVHHVVEAIQLNRLCLPTEAMEEHHHAVPGFANQPAAQFASPSQLSAQQIPHPAAAGHSLPELVQEVAEKLSNANNIDRDTTRRLEQELGETIKSLTSELQAMTRRSSELEQKNATLMEQLFQQKTEFSKSQSELEAAQEQQMKKAVAEARQTLKTKYEKKLKTFEQEYKSRYSEKVSAIKTSASAKNQAYQELQQLLQNKDQLITDKNKKIGGLEEALEAKSQALAEYEEKASNLEQKVKQLSEELASFRKDKLRLMANGADKFFEKLESSGLNFIAYHPGAGHVSVSVKQVGAYLENPQAFASEKVGLSQEAYQYWLSHYEKPCCQAPIMGGKTCGQKIQRHDNPRDFTPGISDRCEKHRTGISAANRVFSS